ncbi:MAG: YcjF family protein [Bacillales bacterium]|jgi:hypothetical protein|nr:YcjF family protein [Bacillales bacterium]
MKKFITALLIIASVIVLGYIMVADAIVTGTKLREINAEWGIYLEWSFYILLGVVVYFLLLRPLIIVLCSPYYSLAKYVDTNYKNAGASHRVNVLIKNKAITDLTEIELLKDLKRKGEKEKINKRLYILYHGEIKNNIDKIIVENAKNALVLTGVSQSHLFDSLSVLVTNFQMIKQIVVLSGFRPTFFRLAKLYLRVLISALVANGLSRVDISSLLSSSIKGLGKVLTDSAVQGAVNALFVLRIGILTRNYIYAEKKTDKFDIRTTAFAEAVTLFPNVISILITQPLSALFNLLKPEKKEIVEKEEKIPATWSNKKKSG